MPMSDISDRIIKSDGSVERGWDFEERNSVVSPINGHR